MLSYEAQIVHQKEFSSRDPLVEEILKDGIKLV